jgi:tetratricopeptide (TPR) repeat protein
VFTRVWFRKLGLPSLTSVRVPDIVGVIRAQALFVVIAMLAVALSIAFIPRGRELALLELESGKASEALEVLEERYAAGERSLATIAVLAGARASMGDTLRAAQLLEEALPEHPDNLPLLRTLGGYYRQLGQQKEVLEVLQRLQSLSPSQAQLDELANLYRELGLKDRQREVLREIVSTQTSKPWHLIELAKLEAAAGNPREGARLLQRMAASHPRAVDPSIVALQMSLEIASGQIESALERGRVWVAQRPEPAKDVGHLANALSANGFSDKALELLQPYIMQDAPASLVMALARVEADIGRPAAGLLRLENFIRSKQDSVPEELAWLRLSLASIVPDTKRLIAAAESTDIQTVPEDLLARVAQTAASLGHRGLIAAVRRRLTHPGKAVASVVAAEICLALGDRDQALSLSDLAVAEIINDPLASTRLAVVELRLMRRDRALAALRAGLPFDFTSEGPRLKKEASTLPASILQEIARTYIRLGAASEGSVVFGVLRQVQPSLESETAWALATSATSRSHLVSVWLRDRAVEPLAPDFLKQLVFLAVSKNDPNLAALAASRLVSTRGNNNDRMLLAEIRSAFGIPWSRSVSEPATSTMSQSEGSR